MLKILKQNLYKVIFNLKASYLVIFISLILWAVYSYNTMNKQIESEKVYAKLINLSGKQRMLSQKTALMAKRYFETSDLKFKEHLKELIDLMKSENSYLTHHLPSKTMKEIYFQKPNELNKKVEYYFTVLDKFYMEEDQITLRLIENSSFELLPLLNNAVNAFEKESNERTEQMKEKERFILIGTIITLIIEALFIMIPAMNLVNRTQHQLREINNTLESKINEQTKMIKEDRNLLSLYLNTVNILIISLDKNGDIIMINKTGCEILGYTKDELIGKNWFEIGLLHESEKKKVKEYFDLIVSNKIAVKDKYFQNKLLNKNGEEVILKWSNSILKIENKIVGVLSSGIDITKEKKQEQIINQQASNVAMGEMIANIAHQWRQPLSIITTSATGIQLQKEIDNLTDEQFFTATNMINDQAQYLSKTIDDFRNFLKGDIKPVVFDINKDINEFLTLVKASIESHHINVITELNEHKNIKGYPNQLKQCFINIFNNSKDEFEKIDENDRYLFIEEHFDEKSIYITFQDSAGGIPENILPKIFDPYFTTKEQTRGTGLGLSMTYDIIANGMNGDIKAQNIEYEYDNKQLKGAKFTITIPIETI